jgi:endonuclease/exonuclease/phosphatase (EEP) superfamily protein YafD
MTTTSVRRRTALLPVLLLCAVGAATVLAEFARLAWIPELAAHFRLQYLLTLTILLPVFLFLRRRALAAAALALMLPNAWYAAPYLLPVTVPASGAQAEGRPVSIVAVNLWYRNQRYGDVRAYLERVRPDVLVLSELTPEWVPQLQAITATYPFSISVDRRTSWGLGVYSRYPLINARSTGLGVSGSVNVLVTVDLPAGDVELIAAHLSSPTTPGRAAMRDAQLAALAEMLGPLPRSAKVRGTPRLLVGDLNVTPFSPAFREFLVRTGMVDARRAQGLLGTWPTWMPLLQIQIDHCLVDPGLGISRVRRGPAIGSDHYPLEITLRQRG